MTSKYFSIGSVRPGLTMTVPRGLRVTRLDGVQKAARRRRPPAPRNPHQRGIGGVGGGSAHSGFLNFKVMRSLSPISSYFDRSKVGSGGDPRGAVRPIGGRVSTPNG